MWFNMDRLSFNGEVMLTQSIHLGHHHRYRNNKKKRLSFNE